MAKKRWIEGKRFDGPRIFVDECGLARIHYGQSMGTETLPKAEAKEKFLTWLAGRKDRLIQDLEDIRVIEGRVKRSKLFD